ncbi:uncharacterized protein K452DRAFT_304361 [Aplosporella prunicola CBS 121167]|uniref:Uncharacterized protein n=1 Tax=Aplosporella prunicola CBS 121167 TaxID=1176127 RepID=A0A6A6BXU2_9PEZI|nr:uncharacterized protein K452DRAFT_304361 [Aplosporella prunicola CBS 121167]KAF2147551.1 hypothetical protein K452DRAFT_304361 [Aplosporella prunicola CBS 121167]
MDVVGDVLLSSHALYARAEEKSSGRPTYYKVVGIILAITSGLFIGVSFVLKKKGLLRANEKYNEAAGEGYGYLRNWMWWTGMTLMIVGEICNFVAYAFVDAILVTPMGALSVVVTAILSAIFLKERLSFVGKIGCFNCIVGSVVIAVNAPEQSSVATIQDMKKLVITPGFLSYAGVIILACLFVALWVAPRWGKKTMMVYISICSMIGGLSVVATQGLGAAIVAQISGTPQFNQWFLYVLLVFVVSTLLTEIIYLNKALNLFNAALVTPTYYVFFTSATIVTSAILFQGFAGGATTIITVVMGFLQICSGVVLLQLSKSAKDVPDSAVFSGDLDQVRTVAEQEEPEYEPRADTLRGGASLLRSFSAARQRREAAEVKTLHSESLEPIGENESVEWDGLRRRRTVHAPGNSAGSIQRRKTLHPPLGMSHMPSDSDSDADSADDVHPGFFSRLSRRRKRNHGHSSLPQHSSTHPVPLESMGSSGATKASGPPILPPIFAHDFATDPNGPPSEHVYGLPSGLRLPNRASSPGEDTTYRPPHLQWADRAGADSSAPPTPPPHASGGASLASPPQKRQFSFQNVFRRPDSTDGAGSTHSSIRPGTARSALSFHGAGGSGKKGGAGGGSAADNTEEERMGLVKGDSYLGQEESEELYDGPPSPPTYDSFDEDDDWELTGRPAVQPASAMGGRSYRDSGGSGGGYGVAGGYGGYRDSVGSGVGVGSASGAGGGHSRGHSHSRSLTGGGLFAAPGDVRIPGAAPGGGSALASSAQQGSSTGAGARVRRASDDSVDSYDEAVGAGKL